MFALLCFVLFALVISFLCSIAEAVVLSVNNAFIAVQEELDSPAAGLLRDQHDNINRPLAAILTLNTIAHTVGAIGVGAQVALVFGNNWVAFASAVMTVLILIISEIIPKTLGARYWRSLAPAVAHCLFWLIRCLYPLVYVAEKIDQLLGHGEDVAGLSRAELAAAANHSIEAGELEKREVDIFLNTLALRETTARDVMTPRTVVFSLSSNTSIAEYFYRHEKRIFSRIPLFDESEFKINGYVLRSDLLIAKARANDTKLLGEYRRELITVVDKSKIAIALPLYLKTNCHMAQVVDEYGRFLGIMTLEDILEEIIGEEIVDEFDETGDMRRLAQKRWLRRSRKFGIGP